MAAREMSRGTLDEAQRGDGYAYAPMTEVGPQLNIDGRAITDPIPSPRLTHMMQDYRAAYRCQELAFVDSVHFNWGIGVVIAINILVLAAETDYGDFELWGVLHGICVIIYLVEVLLRMAYVGVVHYWSGPDRSWSFIDCGLVLLGAVELTIPVIAPGLDAWGGHGGAEGHGAVVRVLRILQLLRLIRFLRIFPSLMQFVGAFMAMMSSFVLIFSILFVVLFCSAIVCTHLLGHAEGLPREPEFEQDLRIIHEYFSDVMTSIFTLFQITTTDNWVVIAQPVTKLDPRWKVVFMIFICFSSWTMISVLTAVVSDSMVMATQNREAALIREREKKRAQFIAFLQDAFTKADTDGNKMLDRQEFEEMISQPKILDDMTRMNDVFISKDYLVKCWEMLDDDNSGSLSIDEFVVGLSSLQEDISTKHVVHMDNSLKRVSLKAESHLEELKKRAAEMRAQNTAVLSSLREQEEMLDRQLYSLSCWQQWAATKNPGSAPLGPHVSTI